VNALFEDLVLGAAAETLEEHPLTAGRHFDVSVPVRCVLAVYAQENGKGIALEEEKDPPPSDDPPPKPRGRPALKVVS